MPEVLKCPACSASLEYPANGGASMRCPYCNSTVLLSGGSPPAFPDGPGPPVARLASPRVPPRLYVAPPILYAMPVATTGVSNSPFRGLAVGSLVCGGVGTAIFCLWPLSLLLGIAGLTLGIIAWIVARQTPGGDARVAIAGTVVSTIPILLVGLLLVGVLSLFGRAHAAAQAAHAQATAPSTSLNIESPIPITAEALIQAYVSDQAAADVAYKGHTLEVQGRVSQIHASNVVLAETDSEQHPVRCFITRQESLIGLHPGDTVAIRGRCTGMNHNISLRDAEIVK